METYQLDVVATRNGIVESRHRVHAAVVDAGDRLVAAAREPGIVTFWRSCAKPFQVMPFVESGGFDDVRWGHDELALACGSHGGEPEHVAIAESMLHGLGLEEGDLACGLHDPLSPRGAKIVRESGMRVTRLHNNCSGKHAAMLARAQTAGWPTNGYELTAHPVQQSALDAVAQWTGYPRERIGCAVDGCGVTVFSLPLEHMARAYARLAAAAARGDDAPKQVVHAMVTRPFLVGGTERFDSILMEATDKRILAKVGADGVHSFAVLDRGLGVAIKVEDGALRAQPPAVLAVLQQLGALPLELPASLEEFARKPLRNTRGEIVGEVACEARLG